MWCDWMRYEKDDVAHECRGELQNGLAIAV